MQYGVLTRLLTISAPVTATAVSASIAAIAARAATGAAKAACIAAPAAPALTLVLPLPREGIGTDIAK